MMQDAHPEPAGATRYAYHAFGLGIRSEIELAELTPTSRANDRWPTDEGGIVIRRARVPEGWRKGRDGSAMALVDGVACLWWATVGAFRVHSGGLVEVDAAEGVSDDLLAFPLLGPVLAMSLHLRAMFVLHASAVALAGGPGIALLGDKGAGKSTTAAAFLSGGHGLLTDDILVVAEPTGVTPRILPGWGQVKLAADAERRFGGQWSVARPPVHEVVDKRRVLVGARFRDESVPLTRLYVLERDCTAAAPRILPCAQTEALPLLLAHAYAARFGRAMLPGGAGAWHLRATAALAGSGRLARLVVPDGIDHLERTVEAVLGDVAGLGRA